MFTAYQRHAHHPTQITRDDFKENCKGFDAFAFIKWIERELTTEDTLPLKKVMLNDFDLKAYNEWTARIASMVSMAVLLHGAAYGISDSYSEEEIEITLNGSTGDKELLKTACDKIKQSFRENELYLKENFSLQAKVEVKNYLRDHVGESNENFVNNLYKKLSNKYDWRTFVVVAWNDTADTYYDHIISHGGPNVWYTHKEHKRCLFVATFTHRKYSSTKSVFLQKISAARESYGGPAFTENIWKHMIKNFEGYETSGIVVRHGNGLRGHCDFFENGSYNGRMYSVLVVPHEDCTEVWCKNFCLIMCIDKIICFKKQY